MEAVLVSNGPGELYTWTQPVLRALRQLAPEARVAIGLVPDQFTSGSEADIARSFGADAVTTPREFLNFMATGRLPAALSGGRGFVLSLGGNLAMALRLGQRLGYPCYRYSFVPAWRRELKRLFVHDEKAARQARRLGAPAGRVRLVGNLVADAVEQSTAAEVSGRPHILLLTGTRDGMSRLLIPFMLGVADRLGQVFPEASFAWPPSRLLQRETLEAGISGLERAFLGGVVSSRDGDLVSTPSGVRVRVVPEEARYAHMRAADLALTIPGTNTLELGIARLPALVLLPMNKPEVIPLEGVGQWLGLLPGVGKYLKRYAVKLFVEGLNAPISLPNRFSGEELMLELKGRLSVEQVAAQAERLLNDPDDLARRRRRLGATMPQPGAAERLVRSILEDFR